MSAESRPRLTDHDDSQIAEYHAVSAAAVWALLLGLLSPLALVDPMLWAVPIVAVAMSIWALRRIARKAPLLTGRKAAIAGLLLAVLFGSAAVADRITFHRLLCAEARQFAEIWFDLLAAGEPEKAFQLTKLPQRRQPLDERLKELYREDHPDHSLLEEFIGRPRVDRLLAFGRNARVRRYETIGVRCFGNHDIVFLLYEIVDDEGEGESLAVALQLQRLQLDGGVTNWRVVPAEEKLTPE